MAEGRCNAALADALVITGEAVGKHVSNIFAKINLPDLGSTTAAYSRPHLAQGALTPLILRLSASQRLCRLRF